MLMSVETKSQVTNTSKGIKRGRGRPSDYTLELAQAICARVSQRDPQTGRLRSLKDVCAMPDMPGETAVYKWLGRHEEFAKLYARAREDRADLLAEEIVQICDEEEDPQRARVRMDARKWVAAKWHPKRYSDKMINEHTGADGAPLVPVINVTVGRDQP